MADDRTDSELLAAAGYDDEAVGELGNRYPGWAAHIDEQADADLRRDLVRHAARMLREDVEAGVLDAIVRDDGSMAYRPASGRREC